MSDKNDNKTQDMSERARFVRPKMTTQHLNTLLNFPCKHIFIMEYNYLCHKTSFLWHAPASQM